jgi:hypothetical protein
VIRAPDLFDFFFVLWLSAEAACEVDRHPPSQVQGTDFAPSPSADSSDCAIDAADLIKTLSRRQFGRPRAPGEPDDSAGRNCKNRRTVCLLAVETPRKMVRSVFLLRNEALETRISAWKCRVGRVANSGHFHFSFSLLRFNPFISRNKKICDILN